MSEKRVKDAQKQCAAEIARFLMAEYGWSREQAEEQLEKMKVYQLLMDEETWMYLESWDFLCACCKIEAEQGEEALYSFINSDDPQKPVQSIIQTYFSPYHHLVV